MTHNKKARKIILEVAKKIQENYRPTKVILFGSYAYGTPKRDSDIDLLIIKNTQDRPILIYVGSQKI